VLTEAVKAADELAGMGIDVGVINARFAKPIDGAILALLDENKTIITIEDHNLACGFGSAVLEQAAIRAVEGQTASQNGKRGQIIILGGPDKFIERAPRDVQLGEIGISAAKIVETVKNLPVK
jgi:1-deoxy-D-xylulose-5-phosphate synthase